MTPAKRPLPIIAVTCGEPGGIGPELVAKLFGRWRPADSVALVIGSPELYERWRRRFKFNAPVIRSIEEVRAARSRPARVFILDSGITARYTVGADSEGGGLHAGTSMRIACDLARERAVAGIVTPPASKKSFNLAHFDFPGHTEMLARYLNAPDCQMMMARRDLRVIPFTRHVPLAEVAPELRPERLEVCIRVTHEALRRDFKIARPRIDVAGLNPHAGEDGVIGTEDRDIIAPTIARLRKMRIDVSGPHPADAMFQSAPLAAKAPDRTRSRPRSAKKQGYPDAYIAMYHDQGLVPYKMLAQKTGVNVTIGLPTPRTSVDHGTAYDIAGRGIAEDESLLEAYRLAEYLSQRKASR
ncbi:MAG TPA: 4-hydroxythreonine-4-phosphate dehydrogenase PdxA [Candidatus Krumholzibacteria bacterium]|nr:4-hydroxythreonine-4-phosphate dehydrogenase PdxA [Candidatus Krumholzibacteria bacterium]